MSEKRYTLLVVPEVPGQVRRVQLNSRSLKLGLGIVAGTALLFVAMTVLSIVSLQRLAELHDLRRENQAQKEQLLVFSSKLDDIKQTLDRVAEFDAKLRVITNAGDRPSQGMIPGTGGPTNDDIESLAGSAGDASFLMDKIHRDLADLSAAARDEERSIQELSSFFQDRRSLLSATPSIWPARGWVTSSFGGRISPFTGNPSDHHGMDIAAAMGTPVRSTADGIVTYAGVKGGYGKVVIVDHGYGLSTRYGHLSAIHAKPGQRIKRGDRVGAVGSTGRSTGPHLHYEVRVNNLPVNPRRYILN